MITTRGTSPPSESDLASTNTSPETKTSQITIADEGDVPSPTNAEFKRVQSAVRRARSPPRNEHNQMYCDHVHCSGKNQTFQRVCEWNKHMDRHERPYKCREDGCELNPGFTYSGGLLRHQREVHNMHQSTMKPLLCPFPNCNRSSGKGFTRKENLKEHRRRRHHEEMSDRVPPDRSSSHPPSSPTGSQQAGKPFSKRSRLSMTPTDDAHPLAPDITTVPNSINSSMAMDAFSGVAVLPESELIRCLEARLQHKGEQIAWLTAEVNRLQNLIFAFPPQTVYEVTQPRLPGGGVRHTKQMRSSGQDTNF